MHHALCRVDILADRLEYLFYHQQHGKIQMIMRFHDMEQAQVDMRRLVFRFRVRRQLRHFGSEYDPSNPQHILSMQFGNVAEAQQFLGCVQQRIPDLHVS